MKTYVCTFMIISCWILLRMRNISNKFMEKIKTHILCSKTLFRRSRLLWNSVVKYSTDGQATDGNVIRSMLLECCITKGTYTLIIIILIVFHGNSYCTNALHCYVSCTVFILLQSLRMDSNMPRNKPDLPATVQNFA